jgi:cell wall-associated NlpC family hydrolase|nr:C40 family peptidase [uncultured Acetatifactor sp.]
MRKKYKIFLNFILTTGLAALLFASGISQSLTVEATSVDEVQGQIDKHTDALDNANQQVVALETEQEILQEQIDDFNAELANTMASIGAMEDQLAAKEQELAAKEGEIAAKEEEIERKKQEIEQTQAEYEAAVAREEAQRENMAVCTRMMYERGEESYLDALLEGKGLSDILNRMDRVEKVYRYENTVLENYITVKNQVHDLWDLLVAEKAGLEEDKVQLETDRELLASAKQQLEADRAQLQQQKSYLDGMLAKKKQESANYAEEIKQAKAAAAAAKELLKQDQERLKQLQSNNTGTTGNGGGASAPSGGGGTSAPPPPSGGGSGTGQQIANYACQFVGNPYVMGGTSLTGGADCSGFVYRVYADFGYSLPRTSYQQETAGVGVSYDSAQPGDIVCYTGHVGIYIGNGQIVHASNSAPYPAGGIKISNATYRPIVAVRRIVN